jgi:hypothetical protein
MVFFFAKTISLHGPSPDLTIRVRRERKGGQMRENLICPEQSELGNEQLVKTFGT